MIRSALAVLPTRPIVYIVPAMVVLLMSFYYWNLHTDCTENKRFRISFNEALKSVDRSAHFRLDDFTNFAWNRARIVVDFKPERRNVECPFSWNWPEGKRESLISSKLLTALIFAQNGVIVKYFELRGDEVAFSGADSGLTPDTAIFDVGINSTKDTGIALTLIK